MILSRIKIVGAGKWIYKSSDGGLNWDKVVSIQSAQCYFTNIYFTDANRGWACPLKGISFAISNKGLPDESWNARCNCILAICKGP